jgi:WD40 repeat protein
MDGQVLDLFVAIWRCTDQDRFPPTASITGKSILTFRQCRLNPLSSQNASLRTKVRAEIAALDINQDRTLAVLAGREILQTVRVNGTSCTEETNIREEVVRHDRINATRHRDNLEIHDVKWSNGAYSNYIACAATNGKVVIYDLNRLGVEIARLHEHSRQVHKVAFCPHQGGLLLSASQDASVKLWDLRIMKAEVMSIPRTKTFAGQSEAIRDVRWSPTDVMDFAFGTDNGSVQKWDHRNAKAPKLRLLRAHDGACTSVDWHPDGKHLLSAGTDKLLKVWDFSSDQPRQKSMSTLKTPYPITNARWRPPCWSEDEYGKGSWQCTQVVTSYARDYAVTHLWDLRRQYIPFREMYTSRQAPTDMLWHSLDRLWSVGRDGDFYQTDIKYAPKTIDRRPLSTFAISPLGEMVAFSQKRSLRRRSDIEAAVSELAHPGGLQRESSSLSDKAELSRSSADDSKEDSFLSTSYQARHHERTMSSRSSKVSVAGTPPALTKDSLAKLNDTLDKTKEIYQPQQVAFRGILDGANNVQAFSYLAQKYKTEAVPENPSVEDFKNVEKAFEQNAKYAEKTGAYRTAQTWRTFGAVLQNEVLVRGNDNMEQRLAKIEPKVDVLLALPKVVPTTKRPDGSHGVLTPKQHHVVGLKGAGLYEQRLGESSSNVATPIARPQQVPSSQGGRLAGGLPDPSNDGDQLSLPPSLMGKKLKELEIVEKGGLKGAGKMLDALTPSLNGPTWYSSSDLEERKARIGDWRAPQRELLNFETPSKDLASAINIPPPFDRHNSDESFAMFSTSTDSKTGPSIAASFNSTRKQSMSSIPENMLPAPHKPFGHYDSDSGRDSQALTDGSYSNSSKVSKLICYNHYTNELKPSNQGQSCDILCH